MIDLSTGNRPFQHVSVNAPKSGCQRQFARNFDFFGSPIGLFILVDRTMGPPQWADLGINLRSLRSYL
jgi:hypothetical protein